MQRRKFGKSEIEVSILGFGAGGIGHASMSENQCEHLLNSIVDAGINLIDTARSYGLSEERIGKYLSRKRQQLVLSTKIGYGISGYQDWTAPAIEAGIDHALLLMHTDWIDIVHLHSCPLHILQRDEIIAALERAVEAGKVRVPAYSGDNEPLQWALESGRFFGLQMSINICDQSAIRIMEGANRRGIGTIAKRALANAPWSSAASQAGDQAAAEYKKRWEKMALPIPPENAATIALRFAAFLPGVHTCLVGSTNIHHIQDNIRVLEQGPLPETLNSQILSAFQQHGERWVGQI